MRISDWSSDVCSSDLPWIGLQLPPRVGELAEAPCATGHRVACRVVSTDQEQPEQCAGFVERGRAHPLVMSEERDDIVALLFLLTPLPELHHGHIKILKADRKSTRLNSSH